MVCVTLFILRLLNFPCPPPPLKQAGMVPSMPPMFPTSLGPNMYYGQPGMIPMGFPQGVMVRPGMPYHQMVPMPGQMHRQPGRGRRHHHQGSQRSAGQRSHRNATANKAMEEASIQAQANGTAVPPSPQQPAPQIQMMPQQVDHHL